MHLLRWNDDGNDLIMLSNLMPVSSSFLSLPVRGLVYPTIIVSGVLRTNLKSELNIQKGLLFPDLDRNIVSNRGFNIQIKTLIRNEISKCVSSVSLIFPFPCTDFSSVSFASGACND